MRNRPVTLWRVPWEEILPLNEFARGVPDSFALEFRRHVIKV
jgi:hypothetical protein